MSARGLHADLECLRDDPSVDFETLQKVDAVLKQHSGQRVVILPHSKKKDRLKIARVIASMADSRPRAIEAIAGRIGVSRVTAWRYLRELRHG